MKQGERCESCKAYSAMTNECRRKSPMAVPVPIAMPGGAPKVEAFGIYPATRPEGWCCEFLPAVMQ